MAHGEMKRAERAAMRRMRYLGLRIVGGVAVVHLVATYTILLYTFPLWFAAPEHPISRAVAAVVELLVLPLGAFYWGGWGIDLNVIQLVNSLTWVLVAYAILVAVNGGAVVQPDVTRNLAPCSVDRSRPGPCSESRRASLPYRCSALLAPLLLLAMAGCATQRRQPAASPPPLPTDCSGTLDTEDLRAIAWYMVNAPDDDRPEWGRCADSFDIGIDSNCHGLIESMTSLGWHPPDGQLAGDVCRAD